MNISGNGLGFGLTFGSSSRGDTTQISLKIYWQGRNGEIMVGNPFLNEDKYN